MDASRPRVMILRTLTTTINHLPRRERRARTRSKADFCSGALIASVNPKIYNYIKMRFWKDHPKEIDWLAVGILYLGASPCPRLQAIACEGCDKTSQRESVTSRIVRSEPSIRYVLLLSQSILEDLLTEIVPTSVDLLVEKNCPHCA